MVFDFSSAARGDHMYRFLHDSTVSNVDGTQGDACILALVAWLISAASGAVALLTSHPESDSDNSLGAPQVGYSLYRAPGENSAA